MSDEEKKDYLTMQQLTEEVVKVATARVLELHSEGRLDSIDINLEVSLSENDGGFIKDMLKQIGGEQGLDCGCAACVAERISH